MPILDLRFSKIKAENNNKPISKEGVKVDMKVNFINIEELPKPENSPTSALKADFEFKLDYQKHGSIVMEGYIIYGDEDKKIIEVMKSWKKDKSLGKEVSLQLMNSILVRSNVKALNLAQEINLPLHLKMPTLNNQK